jgi:hypothetical protein
VFIRKLHRAHEALSQQSQQSDGSGSSGVKTLSASFGPKWPYKRTMSAPASIVPRQDTKQGECLKPCATEPASQVHTGKFVVDAILFIGILMFVNNFSCYTGNSLYVLHHIAK